MATSDARPLLIEALRVAEKLEGLAAERRSRRPLVLVGHTSLIRASRLAAAIARLGEPYAYEARVLLRALLEIQINYSWIRLRKSYSRALRFVKFLPLERLKLLNRIAPELSPEQLRALRQRWERDRASVRHLFRVRDRKGKLVWADSWAYPMSSIEARLREVMEKEQATSPDLFLYTMYTDLSGTVHGSPGSMDEVVQIVEGRMIAKPQPERQDPRRHFFGALIVLVWMIDAFSADARLKKALGLDWRRLARATKSLHAARRGAARSR